MHGFGSTNNRIYYNRTHFVTLDLGKENTQIRLDETCTEMEVIAYEILQPKEIPVWK